MTGSSDFRLELGPSFEPSLLTFERATYGRHDKNGREEFRALVARMLIDVMAWPRIAGCKPEPFPSKVGHDLTSEGWTFFKLEFSTPRASGSARQGRFMFMVHQRDQLIVPVYIYSHAQFPGRVPDGSLRELVSAAVKKSREMNGVAAPAGPSTAVSATASTGPSLSLVEPTNDNDKK